MRTLEAVDLHKRIGGSPIINGVSLALEEREVVGLLGANGAGKTTTLLMLAGAIEPDQGEVRIGGAALERNNPEQCRQIGFVPQETAIYPGLTVVENLKFFAGFYEPDRRLLAAQTEEALEVCGLSDRRTQRAGSLSTGLKRRLNLAIALVHRPRVLILDEATVGMDSESHRRVLDGLRKMAEEGTAILFATHLIEETEQLCHRVLVLDRGCVVDERSMASRAGRRL